MVNGDPEIDVPESDIVWARRRFPSPWIPSRIDMPPRWCVYDVTVAV